MTIFHKKAFHINYFDIEKNFKQNFQLQLQNIENALAHAIDISKNSDGSNIGLSNIPVIQQPIWLSIPEIHKTTIDAQTQVINNFFCNKNNMTVAYAGQSNNCVMDICNQLAETK